MFINENDEGCSEERNNERNRVMNVPEIPELMRIGPVKRLCCIVCSRIRLTVGTTTFRWRISTTLAMDVLPLETAVAVARRNGDSPVDFAITFILYGNRSSERKRNERYATMKRHRTALCYATAPRRAAVIVLHLTVSRPGGIFEVAQQRQDCVFFIQRVCILTWNVR